MFKKIAILIICLTFSLIPFSCEELDKLGLSETEIIEGLKQALNIGATAAGTQLAVNDGYFANAAVKILLPAEAKPILDNINLIPGGSALVNEVILKMNRGAEKAASKAAPIFANAITGMTIQDGLSILKGHDSAATLYLKVKTFEPLTSAFSPEINSAMEEVGAASAWNLLFSNYNNWYESYNLLFGTNYKAINTNLGAYATQKALDGLFLKVAEEEKLIRDDPARRTTDLLKKVFKEQD